MPRYADRFARSIAPASRAGRPVCAALAVLILITAPAEADSSVFEARYSIAIRGITIGNADSRVAFAGDGYDATIRGAVGSFLKLFSDATADLAGSGSVGGDRILPARYDFTSKEGKRRMSVSMAMTGGSVSKLATEPRAKARKSLVPLTPGNLVNVVDPLSAFLVAVPPGATIDGPLACDRVIPVFDGWQRFDLRLAYKQTKTVKGKGDAYSGDVFVCTVRYVPIAGHREGSKSVQDLVDNQRLQVWLAPVPGRPMLAPYKILIGDTRLGDLSVTATRFTATPGSDSAAAQ